MIGEHEQYMCEYFPFPDVKVCFKLSKGKGNSIRLKFSSISSPRDEGIYFQQSLLNTFRNNIVSSLKPLIDALGLEAEYRLLQDIESLETFP